MARASSPFREEEASNRPSIYRCSSSDILSQSSGVGVIQNDVGEPASSADCIDSRPPRGGGVVLVLAEQQGSSCGLGTDLRLMDVDDAGLLDCERME